MKRLTAILTALTLILSLTTTALAQPVESIEGTVAYEEQTILPESQEELAEVGELPGDGEEQPETEPVSEPVTEPSEQPPAAPEKVTLSSLKPAKGGFKLSWKAYDGAAKYRAFVKYDDTGFHRIGDTDACSLTYTKVKAGVSYTFTVRAIDASGAYLGGYDRDGLSMPYYAPPTLTKLESVLGGLRLKWKSSPGAALYNVYTKGSDGWDLIAQTDKISYTDTSVKGGKAYTYTVRAVVDDGSLLTYFDTKGLKATYSRAPLISTISPVSGGVKLTFSASDKASKYRVFLKGDSGFIKLGDTTSLSYTHKKLKAGVTYTYTVRAMDKNGKYISGYNTAGTAWRYIAPPAITSVSSTEGGTFLSWDPADGVEGFRVYRKPYGDKWAALGYTTVYSYTDTTAEEGTLYAYTLRATDVYLNPLSYYIDSDVYYMDGKPASGKITVNGNSLYFVDGKLRQGFVTVGGKTYYYNAKGELQKNGMVGTKAEGYGVADKNGVVDRNFTGVTKNSKGYWYLKKGKLDTSLRIAVSYGGKDWNILNGKAEQVKTEKQRTLFRALKLVAKVTKPSMTKAQKLKACWNYISNAYVEKNPRIPHYKGMDWPIIYANDMFLRGVGNCLSYGAEFAFLAKAIGYENVYACHSGGHGWAEIDGLVYDPEWARHRHQYSYYGLSYNTRTDQNYKSAIAPGLPWMHVKI